jgi:Zn-dependent peptidase ImmA (M78 family)/transcriptional regulator with XRE-family HTH domain
VAEQRIAAYRVSVETCDQALTVIARPGVASVQIILNAFRRKPLDQVLPAAQAAGAGIIARARRHRSTVRLDRCPLVCENRTMGSGEYSLTPDLGRRISQARAEADITQAELGRAVGLDRTAIAKLESGARKVSATELVALASALDRPIDWFVSESPPSVVSRRSDVLVGGHSRGLDIKIDRLARDVAFLMDQGILVDASTRPALELPSDVAGAEALAVRARDLMASSDGPLYDLQRACERVGLLAFSLDLGPAGGDAAYVEVGNMGVALVNGSMDPGRRRFDLAHELGHHLFGDAYAPEISVGGGDGTERLINAFAIHVLLPREAVTEVWRELADQDRRLAAIAVSVRFRASWSATCSQLRNLDLIDAAERELFVAMPPTGADFVALGERWEAELEPPAIPPEYGKRVLSAYRAGRLSAARNVELLWGTVAIEDLPEQRVVPLDSLRREFDDLS